jgi:hypothetical protein
MVFLLVLSVFTHFTRILFCLFTHARTRDEPLSSSYLHSFFVLDLLDLVFRLLSLVYAI